MKSKVSIIHEVCEDDRSAWRLCFQWVRYEYSDSSTPEYGYRFIWRKEDGSLQPARGQARIPNGSILLELLQKATRDGWFITAENENT